MDNVSVSLTTSIKENSLRFSAAAIPLTLQETCLLYLVGHLDRYSPKTLSLLPLHLRHQLLCRLSAYDLQSLENTPVTKGLDESSYWQTLFTYVKRVLYPKCAGCFNCQSPVPNSDLKPKEAFLRIVASHIQVPKSLRNSTLKMFHFCTRYECPTDISVPLAKLFCLPTQFLVSDGAAGYVQSTLQCSNLILLDASLGLVSPSRVATSTLVDPWNDDSSDCALSLMKMLVGHFKYCCHFVPLDKKIYATFGSNQQNWQIVEQYLSHGEMMLLTGSTCDTVSSISKGWKNVLLNNFSTETSRLSKLHVEHCHNEAFFNNAIESLIKQLGYSCDSLSLPRYTGLKEIVVSNYINTFGKATSKASINPLSKLAAIIDGQHQLQILHLNNVFLPSAFCDPLMAAIAKLYKRSALVEVVMTSPKMSQFPVSSLSQVFYSYLFTPTGHKQVLKMHAFGNSPPKALTSKETKAIEQHLDKYSQTTSTEDQRNKSLVLGSDFLPCFLPIFSKMPPLVLDRIELAVCGSHDREMCLPNIAAQSVVLNFTDDNVLPPLPQIRPTSFEVGATACALILTQHIKQLSVVSTRMNIHNSYLSSLGVILARHAEQCKTLQSITIVKKPTDNSINRIDLTPLCESLISLAQVVPLDLKFENMDTFVSLLYKVWKEKPAERMFHKLSLPVTKLVSNEFEDMVEEIN